MHPGKFVLFHDELKKHPQAVAALCLVRARAASVCALPYVTCYRAAVAAPMLLCAHFGIHVRVASATVRGRLAMALYFGWPQHPAFILSMWSHVHIDRFGIPY